MAANLRLTRHQGYLKARTAPEIPTYWKFYRLPLAERHTPRKAETLSPLQLLQVQAIHGKKPEQFQPAELH